MNDPTTPMTQLLETTADRTLDECRKLCKRRRDNGARLVFCHMTALKLLGIPLPRIPRRYAAMLGNEGEFHALLPRRNTRYYAKNVRFFSVNMPVDVVDVTPEIRCVGPLGTWFMLSPFLSLPELVTLGCCIMMPHALHGQQYAVVDFEDHVEYAGGLVRCNERRRSPRGIVHARYAVQLMREKLASPMEARLMLLLIVRGFPEFEVNYPIRVHSGECYYGDIVFVKERTIVEYDGVFHQTQWERDSVRRNRLEESGWRYVQVTRNDFASADAEQLLADRIGAALKSQTGRTYMTLPVTTLEQLAKQRLEGR